MSLCTLNSQTCAIGVLILYSLPEVSLSHWCINTCYTILKTTKSTTKLGKKIRVRKNKTDCMKTKTVQLLQSDDNLQLQQLKFKKDKKVTFTCDVDHKYTSTYHT